MPVSIIEKTLGTNNILTTNYIRDTINLTKSITIKNNNEAKQYNAYIGIHYPTHIVDTANRATWRYYKHLSGTLHELDRPVTITSIDNGTTIELTKVSLNNHRVTKNELLKFNSYYMQLIDKYPEQELYIKTILTTQLTTNISDIINLEDFTIVSYNSELIENNEGDLIYQLQDYINHYKQIRLIPYYSLSDNLFLASQYHILYNFILTKILAIRLGNAKTIKAHTYHIRNYLSSHHNLDEYYSRLTKSQVHFLYRNLLYINNHSGSNFTFKTLIDKLFTDKKISVVNYVYRQINATDDNNYIQYKFNQKLLNSTNLIHSKNDYSLDDLSQKEFNLTLGNPKEITYNKHKSDMQFKNSLFNELLTKDLETIIVDNTDSVRYKLIPTIIDQWAYLLKNNKVNFLVTLINPVTNQELKLNTKDLFKLFTLVLYRRNNISLNIFPSYKIQRAFKSPLPSNHELLKLCYRNKYWFRDILNDIRVNLPQVNYIATSYQSEQYLTSIYRFNIGLWLLLTNSDDVNVNAQLELMIDYMTESSSYTFNDETPLEFKTRSGITDLYTYDNTALDTMLNAIINGVYDNKLDFLASHKYIQKALVEIFKKFNSYTTQVIDSYYSSSPILTGPKDVRCAISEDIHKKLYAYDMYKLVVDVTKRVLNKVLVSQRDDTSHGYSYNDRIHIDTSENLNIIAKDIDVVHVLFNNRILNELGESKQITTQSTLDQLDFLAANL